MRRQSYSEALASATLKTCQMKLLPCGDHGRQLVFELLPPEETRVGRSVLEHEAAPRVWRAYVAGATKSEIARVFSIKATIVRAIIEAARLRFTPQNI